MNHYGRLGIPFLFVIDFSCEKPVVVPTGEAAANRILFNINGYSNNKPQIPSHTDFTLKKYPVPYKTYKKAFDRVIDYQKNGYSFLLNLTFPTKIDLSLSLNDIFHTCRARYKLLFQDQFVVFSPETFIRIKGNKIESHPMKGTIDASIPDAEQKILKDEKEMAEHVTIVDLIRNDLSIVASKVTVEKFRYIDKIRTRGKDLLQVSSKITGRLENGYGAEIGSLIYELLPAGSISGAPKRKTVEIIKEVEGYDRGYYTGIVGYFDGKELDCGVMIRFIERINGEFYYKSGGGITVYSTPESEYSELIDKIYVPAS